MNDKITYHAIIRFLERVMNIDVTQFIGEVSAAKDKEQATIACQRAGTSIEHIRSLIMQSPAGEALLAGFTQVNVHYEGSTYVIDQGILKTILEHQMWLKNTARNGKLKLKSETERKRSLHQAKRRAR